MVNIWNKEASRNAAAYGSEIIRKYYQNTPIYQNVIEIGVWDGDLVKLAVPYRVLDVNGNITESGNTVTQIEWYENVAAKPLYCPVFELNDGLVLFDFFNNQITHFTLDGKRQKDLPIDFHKDRNWSDLVVSDEMDHSVYSVCRIKGINILQEVNINTGLIENSFEVCKGGYPENIQVYDKEVFFVTDFKIRRITLK